MRLNSVRDRGASRILRALLICMIGPSQSYRMIDFRGAFAEYVVEQGQMLPGPCHRINRKTPPISRAHQLHDVKLETTSAMSMLVLPLIYRGSYYAPVKHTPRCRWMIYFFQAALWDPTNGKPLWETRIENTYICNNDNVNITCNSLLSLIWYCFWDKEYQQCRNIWQRISTWISFYFIPFNFIAI